MFSSSLPLRFWATLALRAELTSWASLTSSAARRLAIERSSSVSYCQHDFRFRRAERPQTGIKALVGVLLALVEVVLLVELAVLVVALITSLVNGGGTDRRVSRHDDGYDVFGFGMDEVYDNMVFQSFF